MKGVIGLLLIVVGAEVAYLVIAGKLPLNISQKNATNGTDKAAGKGGGGCYCGAGWRPVPGGLWRV